MALAASPQGGVAGPLAITEQTTPAFAGTVAGIINLGTTDPSAAAGIAATIGSIGMRNNGGAGEIWTKTGAAATAWAQSLPAGNVTNVIADPGTGVAIPVGASGSIAITTAAVETNTMAIPTFEGQELLFTCTVWAVGARTVTVATAYNAAQTQTTFAFATVGDSIKFVGVQLAGVLRWQLEWNDGCTLA